MGVNTFIEGAVTCIGDSVCLQVKLLDQEEKELWIQDFKAERSQILNLYSEITKDIADRLISDGYNADALHGDLDAVQVVAAEARLERIGQRSAVAEAAEREAPGSDAEFGSMLRYGYA